MKIAKLHLLPALLLIAAIKLEFVAPQYYNLIDPFAILKGQVSSTTCAPFTSTVTSIVPPDTISTDGSTDGSTEGSTDGSTDDSAGAGTVTGADTDQTAVGTSAGSEVPGTVSSTARSLDFDYDSLPVNSIGRNVDYNAANYINLARNQQTNRLRRRNAPRRRQKRRRSSAKRRRRQSRQKQRRRMIARKRYANKRRNAQRNVRPQL